MTLVADGPGARVTIVGAVVSGFSVMVMLSVLLPLPCASNARTVMTFAPGASARAGIDQTAVPSAMPLPPRLLLHSTRATARLSEAVPPTSSGLVVVANVVALVGPVIVTV